MRFNLSSPSMPDRSRSQPVVVLHVTEAYGGGTMTVIHDYAAATPELDHVILATARDGEDTGAHAGGAVRDLMVLPKPGLSAARVLRRTVRDLRPDIIHAHSSMAGAMVRATPGIDRSRVAYTPHCYAFERLDLSPTARRVFHGVERGLAVRTGLLVAVSPREEELGKSLRRRQQSAYVPNLAGAGAEAVVPATASTASNTVITVGRVSPQKDPHFLAEVAREARSRPGASPRFVWLGDGDAPSVAMLRDAGVEVVGWLPRTEVLRRLAEAGAYLHTASWESAPLTVLEAASIGLPLVVRRTPAMGGLGIDPLIDTPAQAADRLIEILPGTPDRLRHAELLARHNVPAQRAALLSAYARLVPGLAARMAATRVDRTARAGRTSASRTAS